jgi:molybdate-binding protein
VAQELQSEINALLPQERSIIRIHASHGFAVSALRELLSRDRDLSVDFRYVGNLNSLVSLEHHHCELAGMHLPQGSLRAQSIAACRGVLSSAEHCAIGFVTREMGLIVRRGNPLGIDSLQKLTDPKVRFVNRDPESGTRMLFDELLAQEGIEPARIRGYEQGEFTHAAVAAFVASDMADAAFGVEAASRQFDLDFIRVITEDYAFACRRQTLENPSVQKILAVMRSAEFAAAVAKLPGYTAQDLGVVKPVDEVFSA